jgi:hypothetical protein
MKEIDENRKKVKKSSKKQLFFRIRTINCKKLSLICIDASH